MSAAELVRRVVRPILGRTGLYAAASRAADFCAVVRHDGLGGWRHLEHLRRDTSGSLTDITTRLLAHPIAARAGGEDAGTIVQTVYRQEWGRFALPDAPRWLLDAGAYIGDTSAYFLSRFDALRVLAMEPNGRACELAARNLLPYGDRAVLVRAALLPTDGTAFLGGDSTSAALGPTGAEVETLSIPTLMRRHSIDRFDIVKLDIEGAERELFATEADAWLPRVTLILIEIHSISAMASVRPALERHGFSMRRHRSVWYCARPRDNVRLPP